MLDPDTARRIRLIGFDVDGVLTDNGIYVGAMGGAVTEFKRFDIQDGVGIKLLRDAGLILAIVSGRHSDATTARARELGIDELVQIDTAHKLPPFTEILERHGVPWEEAAYMGDDLADIPLLTRVGLPVSVQNGVSEVKAVARHVTAAEGGRGAVREFVEAFLRARGEWDRSDQRYVTDREAPMSVSHVS